MKKWRLLRLLLVLSVSENMTSCVEWAGDGLLCRGAGVLVDGVHSPRTYRFGILGRGLVVRACWDEGLTRFFV